MDRLLAINRLSTLHDKRNAYDAKIADLEAKINKYESDAAARSVLAAEDEVMASRTSYACMSECFCSS